MKDAQSAAMQGPRDGTSPSVPERPDAGPAKWLAAPPLAYHGAVPRGVRGGRTRPGSTLKNYERSVAALSKFPAMVHCRVGDNWGRVRSGGNKGLTPYGVAPRLTRGSARPRRSATADIWTRPRRGRRSSKIIVAVTAINAALETTASGRDAVDLARVPSSSKAWACPTHRDRRARRDAAALRHVNGAGRFQRHQALSRRAALRSPQNAAGPSTRVAKTESGATRPAI